MSLHTVTGITGQPTMSQNDQMSHVEIGQKVSRII